MIVNHLSRVLGERRWSIRRLQQESGVSYSTLHSFYADQVKRLDFETLNRICAALDCQVGDILEYRA